MIAPKRICAIVSVCVFVMLTKLYYSKLTATATAAAAAAAAVSAVRYRRSDRYYYYYYTST
eukprot:17579-Heterococcus_DN1.PRE.1